MFNKRKYIFEFFMDLHNTFENNPNVFLDPEPHITALGGTMIFLTNGAIELNGHVLGVVDNSFLKEVL